MSNKSARQSQANGDRKLDCPCRADLILSEPRALPSANMVIAFRASSRPKHWNASPGRLNTYRQSLRVRGSKSTCLAPFGRNNFSNVFDLLLDFGYLRMHVTNQIVLRL